MSLDREMQKALLLDAQKLRDQGVDCPDPTFEIITCPKCQYTSGDDYEQCNGSCPMPGSPHYDPDSPHAGGTMRRP